MRIRVFVNGAYPNIQITMIVRIILALSVIPGILIPGLADWLSPLLFPSLFCIMLFSFCRTSILDVQATFSGNKGLILWIVCWQMLVTPLLAVLIMAVFGFSGIWAEFVLLTTCASSVFGAMAFVSTLGLDARVSMVCMLFSTAVMPVVLLTIGIGDSDVSLVQAASTYSTRIIVFIVIPALMGFGYRYIKVRQKWSNHDSVLGLFTTVSLVIFAIAIMQGVGEIFYRDTVYFFNQLFWVLCLHLFLFVLTRWIFSRFNNSVATVAGVLSAYRNLGLTMAIMGPMFWDRYAFLVALWQIPMYLSPFLLSVLKEKIHRGD